MFTKSNAFVLGSGMLLLAAIIFAGTLVWNDTRSPEVPPQPVLNADEAAIPHFAGSNINGIIHLIEGNTITLAVLEPNTATATPSNIDATVIVDSDTEIYSIGAMKDDATYQAQVNSYIAGGRVGMAPDPYDHDELTLSDLSIGDTVNVIPKPGTINVTTLHAQSILLTSK